VIAVGPLVGELLLNGITALRPSTRVPKVVITHSGCTVAYLRGLHEGPDSRYTGCRNFKFERRFHNIKKAADIGFAAIRRKSKAAFVAVGA
jgi:hypothetical protein